MNAGNNILISTAYLLLSYESSAKNNWINNMSPKKKSLTIAPSTAVDQTVV